MVPQSWMYSLLSSEPIPEYRSCEDAHIPEDLCLCNVQWPTIEPFDPRYDFQEDDDE